MTRLDHSARQLEARIGNERRARIGDQRDALARLQRRQNFITRTLAAMIMVRRQLRLQPIRVEQLARDARVLGEHTINPAQDIERAQRDVAQVPDRCGHHIKARFGRWTGRTGADTVARVRFRIR